MSKGNLRIALIWEDGEVFVELNPEVLKTLIQEELEGGSSPDQVYNKIIEVLKLQGFRK